MSTEVRQTAFGRALRAASGCSPFRTVFAVSAGAALTVVPLISAAPNVGSIGMLAYAPQYPHQAYGYELALTRLQRDDRAGDWVAAADRALLQPQLIRLPFVKVGEQVSSAASGYAFSVPVGRRIIMNVTAEGGAPDDLFVDLFSAAGERRERVAGTIPGG